MMPRDDHIQRFIHALSVLVMNFSPSQCELLQEGTPPFKSCCICVLCSPRHLFDQKYNKNRNILKYYWVIPCQINHISEISSAQILDFANVSF